MNNDNETPDPILITGDQDDETPIVTQRSTPIENNPEAFYNQTDSVYIRVKWNENVKGFSFSVRNELFMNAISNQLEIDDNVSNLGAFVRGLIELGMAFPSKCYTVGLQALNQDAIANSKGLSDAQKDLLSGEPQGHA